MFNFESKHPRSSPTVSVNSVRVPRSPLGWLFVSSLFISLALVERLQRTTYSRPGPWVQSVRERSFALTVKDPNGVDLTLLHAGLGKESGVEAPRNPDILPQSTT